MPALLRSTSRRAALLAFWTLAAAPAGEAPLRIMVFGDSQAQGLAAGLQRFYRGDRSHRVLDRSKISTGLLPRSPFDWSPQARILAAEKPDVAIALFGANDRPAVRRNGEIDPVLLDRFTDSYGAKVADIAGAFKDAKVPLIWVGHPIVRDADYAQEMQALDDIFEDRSTGQKATFLSTWDTFKGPGGDFSPYGKGVDGQTTRLRADDGVHMTIAGYDVIAAMLAPLIDKVRPGVPL